MSIQNQTISNKGLQSQHQYLEIIFSFLANGNTLWTIIQKYHFICVTYLHPKVNFSKAFQSRALIICE